MRFERGPQSNMGVQQESHQVSFAPNIPIRNIGNRPHDITMNLDSTCQRARFASLLGHGRQNDLGHRVAEASDEDRLARFLDPSPNYGPCSS